MLFKVDHKKDIRETNPDIDSIEEFKNISDRNLKYIFLVFDYDSPYKQLPLAQRKEKVGLVVGFKREKGRSIFDKNARDIMNGNVKSIEAATKAFKELIYDSDKDTFQSIEDLIVNIRNDIRNPGKSAQDLKYKTELAQKLPALAQTKKQLAQILDIRSEVAEETEENEESKVSTLEMYNEGLI